MKEKFSCILVLLLLVSMFVASSNFQPAKAGASSQAELGQAADTDWWSMFHHDPTHTGYSTSPTLNTNHTLWSYKTGGIVRSSPAVVGGIVYVGSEDDNVYAINAVTGATVWKYPTGGYVDSSPAVVGGVVYVGSQDDKVYAINATTGKLVWNYTTGGPVVYSSPAVTGGVVYVGSEDDKVYALNATNRGALVWNYTTGGYVDSSPAVANGTVYVGSDDHKVYALNATTGKSLWNYTTHGTVDSSPAITNGIVYVSSHDDKVYALNATTGAEIWNYTTGGIVYSSPAVADNYVYVGSRDDKVYALNATNGSLMWSYKTGGVIDSSPAVANGLVYVGSGDDKVYAFGALLPLLVTIMPSSAKLDVGQNQVFSSTVVNGTKPYHYQWYLNMSPVSGANNTTWTFSPTYAGNYSVYLNVTDSLGVIAVSSASNVTVYPRLMIMIRPNVAGIYLGQSQTFNSFPYNGTRHYSSFQWYFDGNLVQGANSSSWTFSPTSTGAYQIYVKVTDTVSSSAQSSNATLIVNPSPAWLMFRYNSTQTGYSPSAATAPRTNQTLWSYTTSGAVDSSPAVAGGVVYVGSYDHNVYALNAITGNRIWNYTTGGIVGSSPAVAGGVVYVGSYDHNVYALNAITGNRIWNYTTGGIVGSSPAVAGGVVYVGSDDWNVYALNAATGKKIWIYPTGGIVYSSPAVAGGVVYVGSWDDKVYALDAATGKKIWIYTTGGIVYSSPAVAGGVVYVGSWDDKVYALDAATDAEIWIDTTGGVVDCSPAVANGVVYVGSGDDKVYALNATTGTPIWNYTTGGPVQSSPAVAGGYVYVGSDDNKTYCLNAATGASVWSYTTGGSVYSSPAVAGGGVYVGSYDNVYAIGLSPSHDVAVTDVKSFHPAVGQNFTDGINVTVADVDRYVETFNVTTYANTTSIASQSVTLSSGNSVTVTFNWNTTDFAVNYSINYTISANVTLAPGETNSWIGPFTYGSVQITKVGDLGSPSPIAPYYTFGKFDEVINSADVVMFILLLRASTENTSVGGTPIPASLLPFMYLGDLGSAIATPPYYQFFKCAYTSAGIPIVNSADVVMFVLCLRGQEHARA